MFGVTNNKQAARNFTELGKLDFDVLLKGGRSIGEVMEELIMDGDPHAPLLEIAQRIRTNLSELRKWLKRQSEQKGAAKTMRHNANTPEAVATSVTRALQSEGHTGTSDHDESLPAPERQQAIEKTLVEFGIPKEEAEGLAATTVSEGYKYLFTHADLDTTAFFTVKMQGGGIQIILNSDHPAYRHLVTVLDNDSKIDDPEALRERLNRASDGLKLLLSAWARYEDEQPDGVMRSRAQQARSDWGSMARRFLEREE